MPHLSRRQRKGKGKTAGKNKCTGKDESSGKDDFLDIKTAYKQVYKDTEHRQKHFITPWLATFVTHTAVPPGAPFGKWSASGSSPERPEPYGGAVPRRSRRQQKGKGKPADKGKSTGKGKSSGPVMHEGLHTTVKIGDEWKPICFKYNSTNRQCKDKCGRVHCCQRCLDKHPVFKCSKAAPE